VAVGSFRANGRASGPEGDWKSSHKRPQQDAHAGELDHAEAVADVPLPASRDALRVVQPGEEAFDFPAAMRASEGPAVLRAGAAATIRRIILTA
jgi:hypothetical protein